MIAFAVNGQRKEVGVDGNTPLLWVLREHLKLTGTKFGFGIASCGACTVHIDGKAVRSCAMPVSLVEGKSITTIEGLSPDGSHPLQRAWIAEQVPQCGYCQGGQIMQAAELLANNKNGGRKRPDRVSPRAVAGSAARGSAREIEIAGGIKTNGPGVPPIEQHGAIESLRVAGGFGAAGGWVLTKSDNASRAINLIT